MKQTHKRGDVREDGYIFQDYMTHANGKTYPRWISPLSLKRKREKDKRWREANPDRCKEAVRNWKAKNPDKVKAMQRAYMKRRREKENS